MHLQSAAGQNFVRPLPAAPNERLHLSIEHRQRKRLGDIIICPQGKAPQLVLLLHPSGQKNKGHIAYPPQSLPRLKTIQARHHHIQKHRVKIPLSKQRQGRFSITGTNDLLAFGLKIIADDDLQTLIILRQQYLHDPPPFTEIRKPISGLYCPYYNLSLCLFDVLNAYFSPLPPLPIKHFFHRYVN